MSAPRRDDPTRPPRRSAAPRQTLVAGLTALTAVGVFGAAIAGAPAGQATDPGEEWAAWAAGQRNEARQPDDAETLASRDAAPGSAPESSPSPSPSAATGPKLPSLDGVGVAEPEVVAPEALLPAVPPAPSVLGPVLAAAPVPAAPVALPVPVASAPVSLPVPAAPMREIVTPVAESAGEATDSVGRSAAATLERPVETVDSAAAPVTSLVADDRSSDASGPATSEGAADLPIGTDRQEEVAEALTALGVLDPAESEAEIPASSGLAQQTEELVAEGTQQSGPAQTVPEQTVPEQTVPEQTVPEQTVPEQTAPEHAAPAQNAPAPTAPAVQEALAAEGTPQSAPLAAAAEGVSEPEALSLADQWIARMTTGATERDRLPEPLAQAPSRGTAVAGQPERRLGAEDTSARTTTSSAAGEAASSRTVPEETTRDTAGRDRSDLPRAEEASDGAIERQAAEREAVQRQAAEREAVQRQAAEREAVQRQAAEQEAAERKATEQRATERRAAAERAERQQAEEEQKASEQCSTDASSLSVSVKQNDEGKVTAVRISGFDEHCSGRTAHVTVNTEDGSTSATKPISGSSVTVSLDEPVDPSSVRSTEVSVG
ncbi:hypothetical protein HX744_26600 [Pseudonocardia sp. ICBG1122]|nr:hypothetical protein [Pseudonocardia pini]